MSTAGPSRSRPAPLPTANPAVHKEEVGLEDEDEDDIIRRAQERVKKVRERGRQQRSELQGQQRLGRRRRERHGNGPSGHNNKRRRLLAVAAAARSQRGTSPSEASTSPRRPVVEVRFFNTNSSTQPVGGDPDDGDDGNDNEDDEERTPCKRCRSKKISCQMQAGKRSSIICKPCHDAKVRCSYSGRPSMVKWEGGANPTGERLAVLESQVAQLLADNWQLRDGQVKANTYHRHFNRKLDWLITDAARRRRSPPEMPEAGPSGLSRKRRRIVDSDEEEEREMEGKAEKGEKVEVEEEGEGEVGEELAPKKVRTEKGKEREEVE
ncbi:hypothetical protein EV359DRAFT_88148 [Lentinula novae-zelandiae]|nr:hypothetical protein EV359DRAFT_88148 [Lentinula novae-zelandiae]